MNEDTAIAIILLGIIAFAAIGSVAIYNAFFKNDWSALIVLAVASIAEHFMWTTSEEARRFTLISAPRSSDDIWGRWA